MYIENLMKIMTELGYTVRTNDSSLEITIDKLESVPGLVDAQEMMQCQGCARFDASTVRIVILIYNEKISAIDFELPDSRSTQVQVLRLFVALEPHAFTFHLHDYNGSSDSWSHLELKNSTVESLRSFVPCC